MRKRTKHLTLIMLTVTIFALLVAACSSGTEQAPGSSDTPTANTNDNSEQTGDTEEQKADLKQFSNDPVTLKVATPWGIDYFMSRIGNHIQEKLPHITLEHIDWDGTVEKMQELYAADVVPDVLLAFTGQKPLEDLEMVYPLDEMLEAYGFDLGTLDPAAVAEIRARDAQGRLVGMPQEMGYIGLHYNKEIFDKFGVEYPRDEMTWDEVLDLAKQMTAERDGVKYRGLEFGVDAPLLQLSVTKTDPESGDVLLTKEPKFTQYMELMKKYYEIPGMIDPEATGFAEKTVAMSVNWHGFLTWFGGGSDEEAVEYQKQMDIAPLPSWPDLPQTSTIPVGIHPWAINSFSEHKEAALQFVIESVSPEYQTKLARAGTPTVLSDMAIKQQFGAELIRFEGKNIGAFTKYPLAEPPARLSYWDRYVNLDMQQFTQSDMNISEFLRKAEEESQLKIKEAMAQQK
ncbi:ABC transporter substrate-binding protein [Paenibacillus sp. 32O-W]|uniref:ABC transporter substrate-binding protein n=1 Tax=Paenibacillus sp. 32O-W TaxID=1695218 RepID=UPI00071F6CEA|nr:extracellular solute-binding protein [Paenibacillus sp. 32O-W]ALS29056.1 ABC transporter substrate-binding protein [Paenibacillus sp. 32O-W]